jgi:hypothetical protein
MVKNGRIIRNLNRMHGAAVLAAPIMTHTDKFTTFDVYNFGAFLHI